MRYQTEKTVCTEIIQCQFLIKLQNYILEIFNANNTESLIHTVVNLNLNKSLHVLSVIV